MQAIASWRGLREARLATAIAAAAAAKSTDSKRKKFDPTPTTQKLAASNGRRKDWTRGVYSTTVRTASGRWESERLDIPTAWIAELQNQHLFLFLILCIVTKLICSVNISCHTVFIYIYVRVCVYLCICNSYVARLDASKFSVSQFAFVFAYSSSLRTMLASWQHPAMCSQPARREERD